jgi:GNAT superfamily N-acetyltransferase
MTDLLDPDAALTPTGLQLRVAIEQDFEPLLELRIAAMRESLERIGRFAPERARQRFRASFVPEHTRHVLVQGKRVGFVAVTRSSEGLGLEHLYVHPDEQGRGIGSAVLAIVFHEADTLGQPLRVGALRDSVSNRFYQRHGFVLVEEGPWDIYYVRQPR